MTLELEIGLALALVALLMAGWQWVRRQRMTRTKGSIVRVDAATDAAAAKGPAKSAKLTIRFTDGQGLVRFFSSQGRGEDRKPGDSIGVIYSPSDPQQAAIDDLTIWVAPIVVGAIGIGLAVMGVLKFG